MIPDILHKLTAGAKYVTDDHSIISLAQLNDIHVFNEQ